MTSFQLNGKPVQLDAAPEMPLLWALRDRLGATGTKYACGVGVCGACTVHLNGTAVRACTTPLSAVAGKQVTTVEGLAALPVGRQLQQAWQAHGVAQCGFCQSGQLMSAAALLKSRSKPTDAEIDQAMSGNLCRCGTYTRIRAAIHQAAGQPAGGKA
ncbi:(2Fe-2S)-binding protein [Aquabacterium sp. OR-4]|uniref:(2Fe-2S)-binding protein n=1 Tax=Aquabacterium sp. OR-4 TaxID=2978127 RepID=UPI0021B2B70C|nr:(2Fe-2S)-binding protein [Aquabacterium sp. OR-4]MDT7838647.1 (2Fe-2S)-binding protein [Aquabacterium sp. OR-4]